MKISYGSVCSGIEAASVAWIPLGWEADWFSEIEAFPNAVLQHRFPGVPNFGDMTRLASLIRCGLLVAPDVLVGGTPCQSFSYAGLRGSLSDNRGLLTLSFVDIANAIDENREQRGLEPGIVVWENVPGVLSTKDNAFGCFLGALAGSEGPVEPAGGRRWSNAGVVFGPQRTVAWRILDAQYFGVAQRRRRVFVVASARDGFDPAAVLFEFEGVRRDSAPSRETGQGAAADVAPSLTASGRGVGRTGDSRGQDSVISMAHGQGGAEVRTDGGAPTLTCNHEAPIAAYAVRTANTGANGQAVCLNPDQPQVWRVYDPKGIAPALQSGEGRGNAVLGKQVIPQQEVIAIQNASRVKSQNGLGISDPDAPMYTLDQASQHAVAFNARQDPDSWAERTGPLDTHGSTQAVCVTGSVTHTLKAEGFDASEEGTGRGQPIVSVALRGREGGATDELGGETAGCLRASSGGGDKPHVLTAMAVRRLTPRECERLQGFPDDWTLIPTERRNWHRERDEMRAYFERSGQCFTDDDLDRLAADGPRYKALGNSMAVPVMWWIGKRITRELVRGGGDDL